EARRDLPLGGHVRVGQPLPGASCALGIGPTAPGSGGVRRLAAGSTYAEAAGRVRLPARRSAATAARAGDAGQRRRSLAASSSAVAAGAAGARKDQVSVAGGPQAGERAARRGCLRFYGRGGQDRPGTVRIVEVPRSALGPRQGGADDLRLGVS